MKISGGEKWMNCRRLTCLVIIAFTMAYLVFPALSALTVDDSEVFIFESPTNTVYFIYSNTMVGTKPLGVGKASPIDWTATGYLKGLTRHSQMEGVDTDGSLIDQSSGAPKFSDKGVVFSGGPAVQVLVKYYEMNRIAPVYFGTEYDTYYWYTRDGTRIDATGLIPTPHNDMFVIEHFLDGNGNAILVVYGYRGTGTFAGAKYFNAVIKPDIRTYTHAYYVYHWVDANNDYFADLNEINPIPVAYGD